MFPPALLPPFAASYRGRLLAAFSTFRFCGSGGASGSTSGGFRFIRVIRVPVFCFWSCFWKRFARSPRYPCPILCFRSCFWERFPCSLHSPPYGVLLSFRAFSRLTRITYQAEAQKWRFGRQWNMQLLTLLADISASFLVSQ